jgi:hypothetical protein
MERDTVLEAGLGFAVALDKRHLRGTCAYADNPAAHGYFGWRDAGDAGQRSTRVWPYDQAARHIGPRDPRPAADTSSARPARAAGQRDTEWPAFVYTTTGDGAGWVPERYLDTSSEPAVVITGYDTTELATTAGEELILVEPDDPSGCARVRNAEGREGWVPWRTVESVPEA